MTTRAVIFDYYGTLVFLESGRHEVWQMLRDKLHIESSNEEIDRLWFETAATLSPEVQDAFMTLKESWDLRGAELLRQFDVQADSRVIVDAYDAAHANAMPFPEVASCLNDLRSMFRVGLLSNADTTHLFHSLDATGVAFDAVVHSETARCYKPDVRIFADTCDALGVDPGNAVYVGATPTLDVVGAQRAGLKAVWVDRLGKPWPDDLDPPDARVNDLGALPAVVERLLA